MSVQAITAQLQDFIASATPTLRLKGDNSLQKLLQPGQVIEARVLRVHQGGRYLLGLAGQEHIADSGIPLQQGQVFHARVTSVGEQVVLERMPGKAAAQAPEPEALAAAPPWLLQPQAQEALTLFGQYSQLLAPAQWQALQAQAAGLPPQAAVLGALSLTRLGLPLQAPLLQLLGGALTGQGMCRAGQAILEASVAALQSGGAAAPGPGAAGVDGDLLANMVEQEIAICQLRLSQAGGEHHAGAGNDDEPDPQLAQALLTVLMNAQQDAALSQRVLSLPLSIDGRLVEMRLALFDDSRRAAAVPALQQSSLRITLALDQLGELELVARLVNRHLQLEWRAASDALARQAGERHEELARSLSALGITVDDARYLTSSGSLDAGQAMREVMSRVVAGGHFTVLA